MTPNTLRRPVGPTVRALCLISGTFLCGWAISDHPSIGGGYGFGTVQWLVLFGGLTTMGAGLLPLSLAAVYLVMFVATFASLGAAELALRLLMRDQYFTAYQYDEHLLFRLRPGTTRTYTHLPINGGGKVRYQVNSQGFVGPELGEPRPETRVMVYGDSFIHAEFSAYEDRFTTRLQSALSGTLDGDVEVVNAGVAGYGPDQILRRMEQELAVYTPDFVVISLFSGNDFGDLLRNRMYEILEGGVLAERHFTLSADQRRQVEINRHELALVRALKRALSRLRHEVTEAASTFDPSDWIEAALHQHQAEYESYIAGDPVVGTFSVDPYSTDVAVFPRADSALTKIALMDAVVGRMVDVLARAEVDVLFMIVPHPMDLLDGDHASGRIDPEKFPEYQASRLVGTLEDIVHNHGAPVINLYPYFRGQDVNRLFLKGGDDHWNAQGQAYAAELVAAELLRLR